MRKVAILVLACFRVVVAGPADVIFTSSAAEGLGSEKGVMRRDPSDIIKVGNAYYAWYTKGSQNDGYDATVWYATSLDGRRWTEKGEALPRGPKGSWDEQSVFTPNILVKDGKYWLFYTAVRKPFLNSGPNITKTAIGIAVADSPDGPWEKLNTNPILKPSDNPKDFDSMRVDDACLIVRNGRCWLYYKGRQWDNTPQNTKLGLAIAERPEGPYIKHPKNPLIPGGHEVLVWPMGRGVMAFLNIGPDGVRRTLQYAEDGISFSRVQSLDAVPSAPGAYRPEAFTESGKGDMIRWGLQIGNKKGFLPFLERFDCVLDGSSRGKLPATLKAVIDKTQSFGLGRYPISFWNFSHVGSHAQYLNEAAVAEWADAGFTVPQSPRYDPANADQKAHILRLLDCAKKHNMKLILCDSRCYAKAGPGGSDGVIPADYADGVRAAVKDFGSHPATLGFHVGDEPGAKMKEAFFACYRTQKEIAPHLFPYANLLPYFSYTVERAGAETWPKYLDEYVTKSRADLISYDCYAQLNAGRSGWDAYYENLRVYREASLRNGVPFWNTILSVGHLRFRCPSLDDIRWQFYTSIASGANGISWFFYYLPAPNANYRLAPVDENWEKTLTYYDIRRVQKNFHRLYGDLFSRLVSTRVTFYPKPFGGGKPFTPNGLVSKISTDVPDHPMLLGEFADVQGRRYVMLVNNSMTDDVIVSISFPGKDTRVFSWNWEGKEYEGGAYCAIGGLPDENGVTIQHSLAPGQEAVYRVQSASAATQPYVDN